VLSFVAVVGKLLLFLFLSVLPILLFAWYQSRIAHKTLRLAVSVAALGLTFFLFAFLAFFLDPEGRAVPIGERLATSLVVMTGVVLFVPVGLLLRKLAPGLFRPLWGDRLMRRMSERYPEELAKWQRRFGVDEALNDQDEQQ
jgi:hypothetical protein